MAEDRFTSTLLPTDNTVPELKKAFLDLLKKINSVFSSPPLPIGFVYVQYPGQEAPKDAFGGSWLNITSLYAGLFFRAEGGNSTPFESGTQLDALQTHVHNSTANGSGSGGVGFAGGTGALIVPSPVTSPPVVDGTTRIAVETRPINQSIRIWKKSA